MEVPKEILSEIADNLEMGFLTYLHRDTMELISFPDPDQMDDKEFWEVDMRKVSKQRKKFIEIENMSSRDTFKAMEEFANSVDDNITKIKLLTALEGQSPFANFKHQIHKAGHYRELWFDFRRQKNVKWIQEFLNSELK